MTKTNNQFDKLNERNQLDLKLANENSDSVIIDAENDPNASMMETIPRQAVLVLPNGQRFFIGSVISAIPFLPIEVNVPDTIAWMYNGIAGIIGGIGQRLPFRPKPTTTESPTSTETSNPIQTQESVTPIEQSRLKWLQTLATRKQSVGMPIVMLPVSQPVPIQLPIQV
ncbi:hypothetical protein MSG28_007468 [Choristoneura fumiferana]|uniref:Uncharacterized protein n=2 Tax=Choristoneura fumiferana TaxID=7141 RepID=A0ACC0JX65_CHOFU|nr:hypothetical protein MSG28_007468 [Choristoneura fumiferana]